MSEQAPDSAPAGEQAYFESEGESPIIETAATQTTPETTETAPETASETEQGEEKSAAQKTVPLAALHEERAKAKEMRVQLAQLQEQTRIGTERLNALYQGLQKQNEPQIPDRDIDPVAHFAAVQEQQRQQIERQNQYIAQQQQERQQQHQYVQLQQFVRSQASEFSKETPDFGDAVAHLRRADINALMAIGHDENSAAQMVQRHHDELIVNLARQDANIPERIYALAKAKGYSRVVTDTSGQQRIATAQKGVAASRSLGSGGATTNNLTLEALVGLPAAEFAEAVKDPKVFRRLMGG